MKYVISSNTPSFLPFDHSVADNEEDAKMILKADVEAWIEERESVSAEDLGIFERFKERIDKTDISNGLELHFEHEVFFISIED